MRQERQSLPRVTLAVSLGFACLFGLAACGRNRGIERTADRFLTYVVTEDYTAATRLCDERLARNMTPEQLKQSWARLRRLAGEFKRQTAAHTETEGANNVVVITCEFAWRKMDLRATFDDHGKITHVVFVSAGKKPAAKPVKPKAAPPQPEKKNAGKKVA